MKKIVIIPSYNEEKNIGNVIRGIQKNHSELDILVINDYSDDKTEEIAKYENAYVVNHVLRAGYGASLQTGYKYALHKNYDIVIQLDGDGQHDPEHISALVTEIEHNHADLAIGSRFLEDSGYRMQLVRKIGLRFFQILIYLLTRRKITDPTSGYQALSKKVVHSYARNDFFPSDFPDADVLVYLIHSGARIKEIPVVMYENRQGKSIHSGIKPLYYIIKILLSLYIVHTRKYSR